MTVSVIWEQGLALPHDPDDIVDFIVDFTAVVGLIDTLTSANVVFTGCTAAIISSTAEGLITLRVSGGTVGTTAFATVQVVMTSGRKQSRTIYFNIRER